MAHTKYTGKSAGTVVTFGAFTIPGWREITIEENGTPLPTPIDVTVAADSAYAFDDDPLGGKTSANAKVTITGLLSVTDKADSGITNLVPGASATLTVTKASGGGVYTLTSAIYKDDNIDFKATDLTAYSISFSNSTAAGSWT